MPDRYARVKEQLRLDDAGVEALLGPSDRWPNAATQDGLLLSHDAIRLDLSDYAEACAATRQQLERGEPLQQWQVRNWALQPLSSDCRARGRHRARLGLRPEISR